MATPVPRIATKASASSARAMSWDQWDSLCCCCHCGPALTLTLSQRERGLAVVLTREAGLTLTLSQGERGLEAVVFAGILLTPGGDAVSVAGALAAVDALG